MASQSLIQRPRRGPSPAPSAAVDNGDARRARKLALARKGLRSLALAVTVPLTLTALAAYVSGCSTSTTTATYASKPTWHPPVWAFHMASAATASLMGLSAWLVWAEGAFHREPEVLGLYLAQFVLGLVWGPLVFGLGAAKAGLVACMLEFGLMFMCAQCFRKVNPIAGDLVKPCLAWVSFMAVFNYKLV